MGIIGTPRPVKLFTGIITSLPPLVADVECRLSEHFGPVDLRSQVFEFDFTHYYDREMGSPLSRLFLSFHALQDPSRLAEAKILANRLEEELSAEQQGVDRAVNLDPGYIEEAKIVLASTKNFYHRLFLGSGIYAEVTMHYEARGWRSFPWTFPDFKSGKYDDFFSRAREIYREQLHAVSGVRG